jgi:hypothetical protein
MENYIVRIYRRDETDPDKLSGTFESVENETRNAFTSLNSLIDLLIPKCRNHTCRDKPNNDQRAQIPEPIPVETNYVKNMRINNAK